MGNSTSRVSPVSLAPGMRSWFTQAALGGAAPGSAAVQDSVNYVAEQKFIGPGDIIGLRPEPLRSLKQTVWNRFANKNEETTENAHQWGCIKIIRHKINRFLAIFGQRPKGYMKMYENVQTPGASSHPSTTGQRSSS